VRIEGGNHSQFGWYGFQPGDRWASISREEQQAVVVRELRRAVGGKARDVKDLKDSKDVKDSQ
jgi:hypothetical protein